MKLIIIRVIDIAIGELHRLLVLDRSQRPLLPPYALANLQLAILKSGICLGKGSGCHAGHIPLQHVEILRRIMVHLRRIEKVNCEIWPICYGGPINL